MGKLKHMAKYLLSTLSSKTAKTLAVLIWLNILCPILVLIGVYAIRLPAIINAPIPDISDSYLLDFSSLLGEEWQGSPHEPDRRTISDLRRESDGVRGSIGRIIRNIGNRDEFVQQDVIRFASEQIASERYPGHEIWAFWDNASSNWQTIDTLPSAPNADNAHIACQTLDWGENCKILLRYDDTIIFINMMDESDSEAYVSIENIRTILTTIDEKVLQAGRI